jgi:hypothetical protein
VRYLHTFNARCWSGAEGVDEVNQYLGRTGSG